MKTTNKMLKLMFVVLMSFVVRSVDGQIGCTNFNYTLCTTNDYVGWANTETIPLRIKTNAAYPIEFYTNGTQYMTILGSTNPGYVGIGIASPQNKLHLDAGSLQITNAQTGSSTSGKGLLIGQSASNSVNVEINQQENGPMNFLTNNAARLKIQGDGKIALGNYTTFTAYNLLHQHVNSATETYHQFTNSTTGSGSGTTGLQVGIDANGNAILKNNYSSGSNGAMNFYTAATNRMTISNAGYVGIAEPNPSALFEVYNNTSTTGTPILAANNMVNYANNDIISGINLKVIDYGSNNVVGGITSVVESDETGSLAAGTYNSNFGDNNIGIDVNALQGHTDTYGVKIYSYGKEYTAVNNIFGLHATASVGAVGSANLVYGVYAVGPTGSCIGTATSSCVGAAGYFQGNLVTNGVFQSSDADFKTNQNIVTDGLSIIDQLTPYSYTFDQVNFPGMNFNDGTQYGFLAQDFEQVLPHSVKQFIQPERTDEQGNIIAQEVTYKAIDYNVVIPLLTAAVKQLHAEVVALQGQLKQSNDNQNIPSENKKSIELLNEQAIILDQNDPNPFSDQTTIDYFIPETTGNAKIIFYTSNGIVLKTVEINGKGKGSLTVYASNLAKGIYSYSLIIDGTVFETKKMVKQ